MSQGFGGLHIGRVIEGGFGPQAPAALPVLLEIRMFERDVQTGSDASRQDARVVAKPWRPRSARQPYGEHQAHSVRAAKIEILAD
jgi:hypothetical protein